GGRQHCRRHSGPEPVHLGRCTMSYPIADLENIAPGVTAMLKLIGIRTTGKLLEKAKDPKGRKLLAARTGIDEKCILRWANMADRMRIKGVGEDYAELLEAAGVD